MLELDDQEKKILKQLSRQHKHWKSTRLIIVIFSTLSIISAIFLESQWIFLLVIGGWGLSYVLSSWHGRPEISLLLKCVEANMKQET